MAAGWIVPFLAGVVAATFAARVWGQWTVRRRGHQLAWASGLTLYAIASLIDAYAEYAGWSELSYRLFFGSAAANVGLLGLGTILLTASRTWGIVFATFAVAGALVAGLGQFAVPLDPATLDATAAQIPFPHPARLAFLLLNVVGGLALIVGAVYSWWLTRRTGVLLIAVGALLPFTGGSLSTMSGIDVRILMQFLGIAVMFLGYTRGEAKRAPTTAPTEA